MQESAPTEFFCSYVVSTNGYRETENSDLVVITAGIARKPGINRSDSLSTNIEIMRGVVKI
ncbi:lactate/malate family dehydrogenase [Bacillus smithii]|uniref:lactate/malate family dehydrogenase n=1 Tax=Bacillus smithii TaxID=1479 RepID=UPI003BEF0343